MKTYTQEEAFRIGREAVALGMPAYKGCTWTMTGWGSSGVIGNERGEWGDTWPDVRSRLTEKAFETFAEDAALEAYGPVRVSFSSGGRAKCTVHVRGHILIDAPTMPEACLVAVRKMKDTVEESGPWVQSAYAAAAYEREDLSQCGVSGTGARARAAQYLGRVTAWSYFDILAELEARFDGYSEGSLDFDTIIVEMESCERSGNVLPWRLAP